MAVYEEAKQVSLHGHKELEQFGEVDHLEVVNVDGSYIVKASFKSTKKSIPENFFIGTVRVVHTVKKEEGPKELHHEPAEQALELPTNVDEPPAAPKETKDPAQDKPDA